MMSDYENPLDISPASAGAPVHLIQNNLLTMTKTSVTGFLNAVSETVSLDGERIRSLYIGGSMFNVTENDQIRFINLPKREQ
jgi:hypothetical protein